MVRRNVFGNEEYDEYCSLKKIAKLMQYGHNAVADWLSNCYEKGSAAELLAD